MYIMCIYIYVLICKYIYIHTDMDMMYELECCSTTSYDYRTKDLAMSPESWPLPSPCNSLCEGRIEGYIFIYIYK